MRLRKPARMAPGTGRESGRIDRALLEFRRNYVVGRTESNLSNSECLKKKSKAHFKCGQRKLTPSHKAQHHGLWEKKKMDEDFLLRSRDRADQRTSPTAHAETPCSAQRSQPFRCESVCYSRPALYPTVRGSIEPAGVTFRLGGGECRVFSWGLGPLLNAVPESRHSRLAPCGGESVLSIRDRE